MKRVLLLNSDNHRVVPLLEKRTDLRLSVITSRPYARFYGPDTDVVRIDDIHDLTGVRLAALEIRRRNPFDHVVSPSEFSLQAGGYLRSYFGLPGPGYDVSNAFSNKYVMKQWLQAAGLPVTPFRQLADLSEAGAAATELGWPVVVKPVIGGGSEDVFVIPDDAALRDLIGSAASESLRRSPYPIIAERFLDITEEFHCDGIVSDGEPRAAPVAKYFAPVLSSVGKVVGSYSLPDAEPDAVRVAEIHHALVKAFGLRDGVTHLEVLKAGGEFVVGEVTHRPGGGGIPELLAHQYGIDIFQTLVDVSIGDGYLGAPRPADDFLVQYILPRPRGVVTSISSADELAALPGVEHVDIRQRPGDEDNEVIHSASSAGVVLIRAATQTQARARIDLLSRTYRIEVS
jgi:biotin carboxylase